ncbi:MAG: pre-peptidase C-terminal domain-containing protein [Anaerolineae bacterium]|nr:pre-peptidase C-terminal domain-containing protein [Anaerolineae bacterium]
MSIRRCRSLALLSLITLLGALVPPAWAQGGSRYDNPQLGVAFDLPAGWQVSADDERVIAGAPADLAAMQEGDVPQGLVLRLLFGSFSQLGVTDASQLPDVLARLASEGGAAPSVQPATWGNAISGYQTEITLPDDGLTTRVALLAVAGGRIAIVRGLAPTPAWNGGAGAQFDALAQTLEFRLPARDQDLTTTVNAHDGGVLWHTQTPREEDRAVTFGGITYDMFEVMYLAAGPGGVLALNMTTGAPISFIGPWGEADYVDIAIGPDTRLYLANAAGADSAITVVDRAGNFARAWGRRGDADGEFAPGMPRTVAVTRGGDVWAVSEGHGAGIARRLYRFDAVGNLLLTVDLGAVNADLVDIRLDNNISTGALFLIGATGALNMLDSDGEPLVVNLAEEVLQGLTPLDIAIAPDDNVIVALAAPGLDGYGFAEFSVSGKLLDLFGFPYDEARGGEFLHGEYLRPAGLVVGPDGTIYAAETNPATGLSQAQAFSFRGDGVLPLAREALAGEIGASDAFAVDPAAGGGAIGYGQTVRGALNNRYPVHTYTFEAQAGDRVRITMRDASGQGELDPVIRLLGRDQRALAVNDDVGTLAPEGFSQRDAVLEFALSGPGTYTLEATRFGGRGEYVLTLERVEG